ncbi:anti-sigma F factor [Bacillus sp. V59.32b]|uniref:anti-sigma F factor n=1 Tax=Bacillus sp. V59.32b TaxID=1758642 RepID=UPI000E3C0756|nr:anti-sigma F factor [Bacillus sp. V59.32b]RFU69172.1 anti-sigma F factor [Bacillus sp. V59.32b]
MKNKMDIKFSALSQNESFARITVAAFIAQLDPTLDELTEIKTVVSEAVTNSIIHGYENDPDGIIYISVVIDGEAVELEVRDEGSGIDDVDEAVQPLYTTKPELERSGMGFTIMENFMDEMKVISHKGEGTIIRLKKHLTKSKALAN